MKRLFLFAAYFDKGVAGEGLLYYIKSLAVNGDVVVVADSDADDFLLEDYRRYALHVEAIRHGEYDFGSYKRCWQWAKQNLGLEDYDVVYLVNDSVFGPLYDIAPYLEKMEASGCDAMCMTAFPHRERPHMQSWFMGFRKGVFMSQWFDGFLQSIRSEADKNAVCAMYETGLSKVLRDRNIVYFAIFQTPHKSIYNAPLKLYRLGLPFIKKNSFVRHNGCLGYQISTILNDVVPEVRNVILDEAGKVWGEKYVDSLMNQSRAGSIMAYLAYLFAKIAVR